MIYLLFAFVVAMIAVAVIYSLLTLRAMLFGTGFKSVPDMIGVVLIIAISTTFAVWLGPIAFAGVGLL